MGNLIEAKERIMLVKSQGIESLRLSSLEISTKDLIELIPIIEIELPQLKILNLANNYLIILPKDIYKLRYLEKLYLTSNQLSSLPLEMRNLKHLKELYFRRNRINDLTEGLEFIDELNIIFFR